MSILSWLKFFRKKRPPTPESELAREISLSIAKKADILQENLLVYQRAKDPFAALLADVYNKDQLSRVHLNGKGSH